MSLNILWSFVPANEFQILMITLRKNITFDNSKIRNRKNVAWITMEETDLCQPVTYEENGSCSSVFKEKNKWKNNDKNEIEFYVARILPTWGSILVIYVSICRMLTSISKIAINTESHVNMGDVCDPDRPFLLTFSTPCISEKCMKIKVIRPS